jgi:acetylornithine deacetylase/succinyl-diaminopimelate desuccinylase-like protein
MSFTTIEPALARAGARRAAHLDEFKQFLAMPSVSTASVHKPDVTRCGQWVAERLRTAGIPRVEVFATAGHAIVYGEWIHAPGKPTVLVYGHYDVQPAVLADGWDTDPFTPTVKGDYVYARGASDMKGQIFAQIKALECITADGPPPVNIKYLIEGEEEIGSEHLEEFIDTHRDLLRCDVVLNCDACIEGKDQPGITYSLRGLAYFEIMLRGPARDLHSGRFGGSIRNPVHVLAELIAGLHDAKGRVTLPGFYDKVRELEADERAALAKLPYSDAQWFEMTGSKALFGEAGYTTLERVGARPTLELNGIWGGYTGEGAKTVLPSTAHCKLSTRLVADQDWRDIEGQLRGYLKTHLPADIEWTLHVHSGGPGAIMDRKSKYMRAAVAALEEVFKAQVHFTREGGSVPIVGMLQEKLGVDSIMLGFGLPDDGIHGPNERQYLPNFYRGIETYIRFLAKFS